MKQKFVKTFFTTLLLSISFSVYTQSLDQANLMYDEGLYEEAKPVFERLVRQSPNITLYNHKYGVCCYETGDPVNAEKYLLISYKRKQIDSYMYLAMLYTEQYRFDEARDMWEGFIELRGSKKGDTSAAEEALRKVRNLLRMQRATEDVQIIDSVVLDKNAFLEAYSLSGESGSIVPYTDFFKGGENISSTVHINQKGDRIYYSKPANNGLYTIFSQARLIDEWGDEKVLTSDDTNDCNYPYVLSDGVTMYFASNGYGSIGGYDIFVTQYNTNTNSYLDPQQMGMPFNSLANDYMMVIDENKGLGWFVTDRNHDEENVCVYLFIPNPSHRRVSSSEDVEDPKILINRSLLTSISDTWRENTGYEELIQLAHTDMTQNDTSKKRDFEFVINNNTIYYTLNEIKSHEAKDLYTEVLNINKQIETLKKQLEQMRDSFTKGNSSARKQLAPTITQAENQLYVLMENARTQEKKARNSENRQIGVNYN